MNYLLEVKNISVKYGNSVILDSASFSLNSGDWLMLTGPNGSGKSTLINAVSRTVPYSGDVLFKGTDILSYTQNELAKRIGVLSQINAVEYSYSVSEIVSLGCYASLKGYFADKSGVSERVKNALEITGLTHLSHKSVKTLSGGELQRVFLAQVFAQNPNIILLDEPTNHLDFIYQKQIYDLISEWLKTGEHAAVTVVHDLFSARSYGNKALLLNKGKTVKYGAEEDVFSSESLNEAFGMDVCSWMNNLLSLWSKD